MDATTKTAQIRLTRSSPAYWRVTFNNPPLNLLGAEFVLEFRDIMTAIETDEQVKVIVFDSAVEGFFLNHSDFLARIRTCAHTSRADWARGMARHTGAPDPGAGRGDRISPRSRDRERK